jgi:hypothetical protein
MRILMFDVSFDLLYALNNKSGYERSIRTLTNFSNPNVSDKVVRIIMSYTDFMKRMGRE